MLRNLCVGIKVVNDIKILRILCCLLRQIRCRTTAKHQYINIILHFRCLIRSINRHICQCFHGFRCPSGKYCDQFHILILPDSTFNSLSQVSITHNCDSDFHFLSSCSFFPLLTISPSAGLVQSRCAWHP